MFIADNTSPYWQCKSGRETNTQTTVTAVPYVLGEFAVFHIVVTTTGAVEFRINGVLVATHSGTGIIPDGAWLGEGFVSTIWEPPRRRKKGFTSTNSLSALTSLGHALDSLLPDRSYQ